MSSDRTEARVMAAEEVWDYPADSRLVAIRWDLLEWGLVLDFDVPESEAEGARMRRGWLAFDGVSDITIPFDHSRLPTGCFMSGGLAEASVGKFSEYVMSALFPVFDGAGSMEPRPAKDMVIEALGVTGILSLASATPGEYGLSYSVRNELASEQSLLSKLSGALEAHP